MPAYALGGRAEGAVVVRRKSLFLCFWRKTVASGSPAIFFFYKKTFRWKEFTLQRDLWRILSEGDPVVTGREVGK